MVPKIPDLKPISHIHAITKIVAKMMATRLSPHMNMLVPNAHSAFSKNTSILGNFLFFLNMARKIHKTKTPTLLFKLDIKKAFDFVRWDYLMDVLGRMAWAS
jgi:hypothetical protein